MMYFILYLEMSGLKTTPLLPKRSPNPSFWCSRYDEHGTTLRKKQRF